MTKTCVYQSEFVNVGPQIVVKKDPKIPETSLNCDISGTKTKFKTIYVNMKGKTVLLLKK